MPHGNKKSSSNNNKKKKSNQSTGSRSVNGVTSTNSTNGSTGIASSSNNSNANCARQIPNWRDFPDWSLPTSASSSPKANLSTIYQRYKQATERFKDSLLQLVPSISSSSSSSSYTAKSNTSVQTLLDAVDYLKDQSQQQLPVDNWIMTNNDMMLQMMEALKTAINFRQQVTRSYYQMTNSNDIDEGQNYFVKVLNYCWITLKPIVRQYCNSINNKKKDDDSDSNRNRFSALSIDDVLDDTDTIDATKVTTTPVRPASPILKEYTIHDLTHGDDYFCALMFLNSMDEMMQFVSKFYGAMKKSWRTHTDRGIPSDTFVEDIMEAAVGVNFSIQQIMMMEEELQSKYPYLNTVYRMMVFMGYPSWVKEFTDRVIGSISNPSEFLASRDAIAFMGDIVEYEFRNHSDHCNDASAIATKFCTKWKLDANVIHTFVEHWKLIIRFEAPSRQARAWNKEKFGLMTELGSQSYSWLAPFKYIGGSDRRMMNTIRMLQGLSNVVKKGKQLILKRGSFGRQWDEAQKKATKIHEDMDELLMGDLLPTLLSMCTDGVLSAKLPRESELLTFFTVLKSFAMSPEKSVPWSLAFAVHALLTSIFEMQGDNDIEKLGRMAKSSWDTYIRQVHALTEQNDDDVQAKHWHTNLHHIHSLRWLVSTAYNQGTLIEERALWNPLCAGLFMKYICFVGNLDCGMVMIDSFAQLRMVLHLYNAFVQVGKFRIGDLPFLDWLYNTFKDSKAIWEGPMPKKGEFVKRWWISYGASIKSAQQWATTTHTRLRGSANINTTTIRPPPRLDYRDMTPLNPEDIANCFRRVCLHDFAGIEDQYHTESQRQQNKGSLVYELLVRLNATMDNMESEQKILASNFIVIGSKLNEFVVKLFDVVLEWKPQIDQILAETPNSAKKGRRVNGTIVQPNSWDASDTNRRRLVMVHLMAERLLGPLDVVPTLDEMFDSNPDRSLSRTAAFLHSFDQINPRDMIFFTPSPEPTVTTIEI